MLNSSAVPSLGCVTAEPREWSGTYPEQTIGSALGMSALGSRFLIPVRGFGRLPAAQMGTRLRIPPFRKLKYVGGGRIQEWRKALRTGYRLRCAIMAFG